MAVGIPWGTDCKKNPTPWELVQGQDFRYFGLNVLKNIKVNFKACPGDYGQYIVTQG